MSDPDAPPLPSIRSVAVDISPDAFVATVTIDRPEARNALDRRTAEGITAAVDVLSAQPLLRAMILTGAGDRAFSAGADLRERRGLSPSARSDHTAAIAAAADAVAAVPVPTIAAVRGFALAGGAELALACDLRIAGFDAQFGFPEVRIGIFPGAGGVDRLPALVGPGATRDLLFTGRRVSAEEAFRLGLVDRLVPPERVVSEAVGLADEIARNAPLAVRAVKAALAATVPPGGTDARQRIDELRRALDGSADYDEGLAAYAAKRAPNFRGR